VGKSTSTPFVVLKKGKIRKEIITDVLSAPVDLYNIVLIPQEALKAPYKKSQLGNYISEWNSINIKVHYSCKSCLLEFKG
jgi:hypothetical protein